MKYLATASQSHLGRAEPLLHCEVTADGHSVEGNVIDISKDDVCILLPAPLFARLRSTPVVVTIHDGSWGAVTGHVKCQQQIEIGEVLILIQMYRPPAAVPGVPFQCHDQPLLLRSNRAFEMFSAKKGWLKWARKRTGYFAAPFQDQRLIPRLPLHTTCAVFTKNTHKNGVTRDVSFTGFSVLFSDFSPECLWNAMFHMKFVKLKARPIGLARQSRCTVVRFQVESIQEGEHRWRELHYSFWQHLS